MHRAPDQSEQTQAAREISLSAWYLYTLALLRPASVLEDSRSLPEYQSQYPGLFTVSRHDTIT